MGRKGTQKVSEAYLKFLYTDAGQETIARYYYRPISENILAKNSARFPQIELFPITAIASDWDAAQAKFFAEGALFDAIYKPSAKPSNRE